MPITQRKELGYSKIYYAQAYDVVEFVTAKDNLYLNVSSNPGGNNPFGVIHYKVEGSVSNGSSPYYDYINSPSVFYDRPGYVNSNFPAVSFGELSTQILAATNPSRPDVLLPSFLAELKDIPGMVKQLGRVSIALRDGGLKKTLKKFGTEHAAEINLATQFGWRPFIQDLWTMVNFTKEVERRKKELDSLVQKGGLRRTLSKLKTLSFSGTYDDAGLPLVRIEQSLVAKGTVIWLPTYSGSANLTPNEIRRVVNGTNAGAIAANVWEQLPWSWFTDYFYDVSSMLQAGNRTIASPSKGWITVDTMCQASHDSSFRDYPNDHVSLRTSAGTMTSHSIERRPLNATTSAHFPTLGAGQLSILGSLAVVKNRKVLGF